MIYLDSAATTLQKPPAVARAVSRAVNTMASPGRGGHPPAMLAANTAFRCRELAAELFQVDDPARVIFTFNATHSLNIAIHSVVKPGDAVLISGYEHNAVTRPLAAIEGVTVKVASGRLFDRTELLEDIRRQLATEQINAVVCTHVSNVFGFILPIAEIAALCRRKRVPLIVDASQSAGCCPIKMEEWEADFVAMPGHKGLYGPQGTGLLLCGRDTEPRPLLAGGTGSASMLQQMPEFLPDRLEAGTHNIAGIAGLAEGLGYVRQRGAAAILGHEQSLTRRMADGLLQLPGIEVYRAPEQTLQAGVLSFRLYGADCEDVGERLAKLGIAVRAGLHCAPLAHQTAGTLDSGTVRASVSAFNQPREIERFLYEMNKITRKQ